MLVRKPATVIESRIATRSPCFRISTSILPLHGHVIKIREEANHQRINVPEQHNCNRDRLPLTFCERIAYRLTLEVMV